MTEAELIVTADHKREHKICEAGWKKGQTDLRESVTAIAVNLYRINEMGTYRLGEYKSMHAYLQGEGCELGQSYTVDLMHLGACHLQIRDEFKKLGIKTPLPAVTSHGVALHKCCDDGTQKAKVWSAAVEEAGGVSKVTADKIKEIADRILPPRIDKPRGRPATEGSKPATEAKNTKKKKKATEEKAEPSPESESAGEGSEPETSPPAVEREPGEGDCPLHLVDIIPKAAEARAFQKEIQDLKLRLRKYGESMGGSYLHLQDSERLCDQLKTNVKESAYEKICPGCRGEPVKTCKRCAGRGFIANGQNRTLTTDEKSWLDKQPHKGEYL